MGLGAKFLMAFWEICNFSEGECYFADIQSHFLSF